MKRYKCTVCGYIHTGMEKPTECPICMAKTFEEAGATAGLSFACEHEIADSSKLDKEILEGLKANFNGECMEVGMYLAMSRVADREGYPEAADAFRRYALEEADHAAKFAELIGTVLTSSTKENLKMRMDAEHGACEGKLKLAKRAKELNLDAIHDTVHEMAKDEARHGKGFEGLYKRLFK